MKAISNQDIDGLWRYVVLIHEFPEGDNPNNEIKKVYHSFWDFNEAKGYADNIVKESRCWCCVIDIMGAFGKVYETHTEAALAGVQYFWPLPEYENLVTNIMDRIAELSVKRFGEKPSSQQVAGVAAEAAALRKGIPFEKAQAIGKQVEEQYGKPGWEPASNTDSK